MSADFAIKQGDRLPALRVTCQDADNVAVNLSGATASLKMKRRATGATTSSYTMSIVDAAAGIVQYAWGATDTATVGTYDAEVVVTFADTRQETFPNNAYIVIQILAEI